MSIPIFLQPIDVWLFRDGKPFDAGSDHSASSLFPPMPSVIQGALRSHYLVTQGVGLSKANAKQIEAAVGTAKDFRQLRLRGPFIRRDGKVYFALPMDVAREDKQGQFHYHLMELRPTPAGAVSAQTPWLLHLPAGMGRSKFEPSGQWISQADMAKYLQGNAAGIQPVGSDALFERETRYGIQQEAGKRVVKEGMLFQVEYIRPCEGVGLHVELDAGLDGWKPSGRMRIGGEGHGARFEAKPLDAPLPELKPLGRQFKLILTTPAYFEGGWQPADWNAHFTGGKVVLQAAALGRYLSIGGYDWATNDHKPARRYVPAGSVYYFRADADVSLKNNWLCDAPGGVPIGQIGYGQVVVAQW